jgi:hypothetical protein
VEIRPDEAAPGRGGKVQPPAHAWDAGLLRQQITTDPVASGAQPVLYTGSDAAPDRVDSTIDYAGQSALAPSTAWQLGADTQQAVRKLVQFQRVTLTSGHAADLTLHVSAQALSSWSTAQQKWVLGTGTRTIYVGPSSRELPLQATATVGRCRRWRPASHARPSSALSRRDAHTGISWPER